MNKMFTGEIVMEGPHGLQFCWVGDTTIGRLKVAGDDHHEAGLIMWHVGDWEETGPSDLRLIYNIKRGQSAPCTKTRRKLF